MPVPNMPSQLPAGIDLNLLGLAQVGVLNHPPAPVPLAYTNSAVISYLIAHPGATPTVVAKAFGQKTGWFLSLLASDSFQLSLDPQRHLIHDPAITATMEERFRALTLHSLAALQTKLAHTEVTDFLVVKAAEIGVKALGLGVAKIEQTVVTTVGNVDTIADRLVAALEKQRRNIRSAVVVEDGQVVSDGS